MVGHPAPPTDARVRSDRYHPPVDFELSPDQVALRDAADDLLDDRADPRRVRLVVDAGGGWDRDLWGDLCAQGWPGIAAPESVGGVGLGWVEAAVLLESVGAHVAPVPILGQLVAVDAVVTSDPGSSWTGPLVDGSAVAAVAFRQVRAERDGDRWLLSGATEPVPFAPSADVAVVSGVDGDGTGRLFLVEVGDGRPPAEPAMDQTREVGRYAFDATPAVPLGGVDAVRAHVDRGAVAYSAELLGAAARCLDLAVAYARERVQFGRPIGSFQAVKHRCADMLVDVEGMRSTAWWAAWCLSVGDDETPVAASTAKAWCSDASDRVLRSALQVHGGIGFTWECDVHLYLKRVQLDRVAFGTAAFHRDRLATLLRARVEAGDGVI
jgi:alkylation response protein AidB-like acyl-CoA dehydrogenase